jgi:hypothetical protein
MPRGKTCYWILSSRKKHLDEFKQKAREAMYLQRVKVYRNISTEQFNFLCFFTFSSIFSFLFFFFFFIFKYCYILFHE